jgi:hypothetical protein
MRILFNSLHNVIGQSIPPVKTRRNSGASRVESVQAIFRANPQSACLIKAECVYMVVAEVFGSIWIMAVGNESTGSRNKVTEPLVNRAEPEGPVAVFNYLADGTWLRRKIFRKVLGFWIKAVQNISSAYPYSARTIQLHGQDTVATQAARIRGAAPKLLKSTGDAVKLV